MRDETRHMVIWGSMFLTNNMGYIIPEVKVNWANLRPTNT